MLAIIWVRKHVRSEMELRKTEVDGHKPGQLSSKSSSVGLVIWALSYFIWITLV